MNGQGDDGRGTAQTHGERVRVGPTCGLFHWAYQHGDDNGLWDRTNGENGTVVGVIDKDTVLVRPDAPNFGRFYVNRTDLIADAPTTVRMARTARTAGRSRQANYWAPRPPMMAGW